MVALTWPKRLDSRFDGARAVGVSVVSGLVSTGFQYSTRPRVRRAEGPAHRIFADITSAGLRPCHHPLAVRGGGSREGGRPRGSSAIVGVLRLVLALPSGYRKPLCCSFGVPGPSGRRSPLAVLRLIDREPRYEEAVCCLAARPAVAVKASQVDSGLVL